jgi:4-amino-4-deoxy-L-arabinose transferase-like glycosyltransferase
MACQLQTNKSTLPHISIMITAFFLRVFLPIISWVTVHRVSTFTQPDTASYVDYAKEILLKGLFFHNSDLTTIRTPGYPVFLIPGLLLNHLELYTISMQILLGMVTVCLVYRLTLRLFNNTKAANLSALIYAIDPISVIFCSQILTETLSTFLLFLSLYLLVDFIKKQLVWRLALSAILLSLSAFVRPVNLYISIVVTLYLVAYFIHIKKALVSLLPSFIFVLLSLFPCLIWQIHYIHNGEYNGFTATGDHNLYFNLSASTLAKINHIPFEEQQELMGLHNFQLYFNTHPGQVNWTQSQIYKSMGQESIQILLTHISVYLPIHLKGIFLMLFGPGSIDFLKMVNLYPDQGGLINMINNYGLIYAIGFLAKNQTIAFSINLVETIFITILYSSLIVGWFKSIRIAPWISWLVFVVILYIVAISGGPQALSRYRHPLMPIFCVFSGQGIISISNLLHKKTL